VLRFWRRVPVTYGRTLLSASQIVKQVPPTFRATRRGSRPVSDRQRQQFAIDVCDPLVDRVPALFSPSSEKR